MRAPRRSAWLETKRAVSRASAQWHHEGHPRLHRDATRLPRADELEIDFADAVFFVFPRDFAAEGEHIAGPHLLFPTDARAAHVLRAKPVGGPRVEHASLEHADRERGRVSGFFGELLVVVDRIHVARRTLVANEIGARERPHDARRRKLRL